MKRAICHDCRHLRETTCEAGRAHYMACGFPLPADVPPWLRHAYAASGTEAQRLLTRWQLDEAGIPAQCDGFAARTTTPGQDGGQDGR